MGQSRDEEGREQGVRLVSRNEAVLEEGDVEDVW